MISEISGFDDWCGHVNSVRLGGEAAPSLKETAPGGVKVFGKARIGDPPDGILY